MSLLHILGNQYLPEGLKPPLRRLINPFYLKALIAELDNLPISETGVSKDEIPTPFVRLRNGLTLHGQFPTESELRTFASIQDKIGQYISPETIGVATAIITRYLYPHAMPNLTMPYSERQRRIFHPQHVETIEDLPKSSVTQKNWLKKKFTPKPGESFLDIGAYIGFGAIRMTSELGNNSMIIAVEADPTAQRILRKNLVENNITNISVAAKAIWNEVGLRQYKLSGNQANTLVEGILQSPVKEITVEADSIDNLLQAHELESIDIVSITLNGAEVEALQGMEKTLAGSSSMRMSIAGWYKRDGKRVCDIIRPILKEAGFETAVGKRGGVLAWR